MKKKASVTLNAGRQAALIIAIVYVPLLLVMLVLQESHGSIFFGCSILIGALAVCIIADLVAPARITLTDAAVQLYVRRSKKPVTLPWTNFACVYELTGCKMSIYLFTPAPMDAAAQLAAYKACCKNKTVPYTHEGCLILNAQVHSDVINQYIPAHIQKMPWHHCAKI